MVKPTPSGMQTLSYRAIYSLVRNSAMLVVGMAGCLLIFVCLHFLPKTQIQEKLLSKVTCPLTQDFTKPAQHSGNI